MAKSRTHSTPAKKPRAPRAKKAAAPKAALTPAKPDTSRPLAQALAKLALEKKAVDVVMLDVRGLTSYAEYLVLMSAESEPQMNAIADHLTATMKERGERPLGVEGTQAGQWVLIDFGDVVAHVFYPEARSFYDLERLWADAPRFEVRD